MGTDALLQAADIIIEQMRKELLSKNDIISGLRHRILSLEAALAAKSHGLFDSSSTVEPFHVEDLQVTSIDPQLHAS